MTRESAKERKNDTKFCHVSKMSYLCMKEENTTP